MASHSFPVIVIIIHCVSRVGVWQVICMMASCVVVESVSRVGCGNYMAVWWWRLCVSRVGVWQVIYVAVWWRRL